VLRARSIRSKGKGAVDKKSESYKLQTEMNRPVPGVESESMASQKKKSTIKWGPGYSINDCLDK
jgi:hypothetical protein